ncbi:alcohol dehydrogenase-like protein [Xylariaceae sp. FL0255]|nr:alcohol dehydrogenase-like protein [Xylariaceae sp. FL0255]
MSDTKTHKACVYSNPGKVEIELRDVSTPEPGPNEVLVKLTHSGVCHSDFGIMMQSWLHLPYPTQEGQVGGHEGVGFIEKLGTGSESAGVKVGDRVGIKWVAAACLACPPCLEGFDGLCFNQKISGYYTPGTFQQYVVGPANYVTPIPASLPGELAAPMLCGGVTTYAALRRSGAGPGEWVAILGAGGGLGTIATSLASHAMGLRVVGIDTTTKKESVLAGGAEYFIDHTKFDDTTIGAEVKKLTGLGAKAVICCTASNKAYGQCISMLRFGGTLVCVGIPEGEPVPIGNVYARDMVSQMYQIVGSAVGNRREAAETLEIAARGIIKFPVKTVGMSELQSVFEDMEHGNLSGRVVLDLEKV